MSNQLVKKGQGVIEFTNYEGLEKWAIAITSSRICPAAYRGKPQEAMACALYGMELGVSPFQAIRGIYNVNGQTSIYGDLMLGLCKIKSDFEYCNENESDDNQGVCRLKRKGEAEQVSIFTIKDAVKAGLWNNKRKTPWIEYPARMLRLRARGFGLRNVFPHHLVGLITVEEAQDYPEEVKPKPKDITPKDTLVFAEPLKTEAVPIYTQKYLMEIQTMMMQLDITLNGEECNGWLKFTGDESIFSMSEDHLKRLRDMLKKRIG